MWNELFWSLFFGTFVLEDVALASMITLIAQEKISSELGFLACFLGISVGDLAIYYFGWWLSSIKKIEHYPRLMKLKHKVQSVHPRSMLAAVFICRFVPGTRVITYLAAGFQNFSQISFWLITVISVGAWVGVAMLGAHFFAVFFINNLLISILLALLFLFVLRKIFILGTQPIKAQQFLNSYRKYLSFEFWPPWLFYPPLIFYIIYLMIKNRSITALLDANPQILYGGLLGESKWEFYQHMLNHPFSLPTYKIHQTNKEESVEQLLKSKLLSYPFILKPDVGQRGFAVRIIRDSYQLSEYLNLANFDLIAQKFCSWQNEAGLFYIRKPNQNVGFIFSVTDKTFPFITGDGKRTIAQHIFDDPRARIISETYLERAGDRANEILKQNEIYYLSECGNHCQGAIFKNGKDLITPQLTSAIDELAKKIPDFYFGRFDIRYESKEKLIQGLGIQVVEVNGAGSEATHIWDPQTTYLEAYQTLITQWNYLFEIGLLVRKLNKQKQKNSLFGLAKAYFNMLTQKKDLQSSS